ncbi:hypothetical protein [Amycolatopsis sp. WAC 01375]|uniref:hypothetical protein n=1 Tax=Amycolatopsis sp. WAC 01375 TaxID=2203194 RepID=UPI000F798B48|nr:hypothetical protein [Amycolatopsis sp. WAC 01375]
MKRLMYVLASLLLVGLAGCSSATDSGAATVEDKQAGLKFAQCMRENGVPDFEDPTFDENGEMELRFPPGTDPNAVKPTQEKCKRYLPNGGEPEKMNAEDVKKFQAYAKCMRENGMPDYPDPDAEGRSRFESGKAPDPNDPGLKTAHEKCGEHLPGGGGGGLVIPGGGK